MLIEKKDVQQRPGESHRRWFSDEFFDLIVWWSETEEIILFQLSYDPDGVDGLLEWRRASGLSHFRVDTGGPLPARHARTPFLVPAPAPELGPLVDQFETVAAELDPALRDFVLSTLRS